jgi:hypothetical protein
VVLKWWAVLDYSCVALALRAAVATRRRCLAALLLGSNCILIHFFFTKKNHLSVVLKWWAVLDSNQRPIG